MKKKVLLIEDNDFLADIYSVTLKELNVEVTHAPDGQDGLNKASKGGWDLILCDVTLPKMNGFDIARHLKETPPEKPNKKLVFLSSLDNQAELDTANSLGNGFINKSDITPGDLAKKVSVYLK